MKDGLCRYFLNACCNGHKHLSIKIDGGTLFRYGQITIFN